MARGETYSLRAGTRNLALTDREHDCGLRVCAEEAGIELRHVTDDERRARFVGVMQCGHIWSCPVCAARLCAERGALAVRALDGAGGRWQMITVTLAHHSGMTLTRLLHGLLRAWRRARQGGVIQRLWGAYVSATIRAIEITWSPRNGWHPHVHVLLRTAEWPADDRRELTWRWQECVRRELGRECLPNDEQGIFWSLPFVGGTDAERARYVAKLGLEIAGASKDKRSVWAVARRAAQGDGRARAMWTEYQAATRGRRRIEFDERAYSFAKPPQQIATPQLGDAPVEHVCPELPPRREPVFVPLNGWQLYQLRRGEWRRPTLVQDVLGDVETSEDPARTVQGWVEWCSELGKRELAAVGSEACPPSTSQQPNERLLPT